jgi:diguanylate cyclase (GGDEF)-like protein
MKKNDCFIEALKSFSGNLFFIDHNQKDNLYYLLLTYCIDYLQVQRATFLKYMEENNCLYNSKTVVSEKDFPDSKDSNDLLKYVTIDLNHDFRRSTLKDRRVQKIRVSDKKNDFSTEVDFLLHIETEHILFYPLYFQNQLIGVIETAREKGRPDFNEDEISYFEILMNFSAALISNIFIYEWAIRDSLTDCYAVTYFNKVFDEYVILKNRYEEPFTLMMLDIDNFKKINDTYGHIIGDRSLVFFVDILRKNIRTELDLLARYGGDEFCLLLRKCDTAAAEIIAGRIIQDLTKETFDTEEGLIKIQVSIGIAQYELHGKDRETLLAAADKALYQSKRNGKSCHTVYQP